MPVSTLCLIKRCNEKRKFSKETINKLPKYTRGIYALLQQKGGNYDVLYIGMSRGMKGIKPRILAHLSSKTKSKLCTHFSVFEVHDNISESQIQELEGLFRHIYRDDAKANRLNKHTGYDKLRQPDVRYDFEKWAQPSTRR